MSDATLKLSQHELYFLPPGTPAVAEAIRMEVEINGERQMFLARLDWTYLEADKRGCLSMFCQREDVREVGVFGGMSWILKPLPPFSQQQKRERTREILELNNLNRYWRAPDASYGVTFRWNGIASIYWGWTNHKKESVSFRWNAIAERDVRLLASRQNFLQNCQQFHADENSSLNDALRWAELTEAQRDAIAFHCENGNWERLRQLFWLAQKVVTSRLGTFPLPGADLSRWKFDSPWPSVDAPSALEWSMRWRKALCNIVRPAFWNEEPLCVKEWRKTSKNIPRCVVTCAVPTAHELLEAQLELRDFLRPHLPESEIEALLRPA